MYIVMLKAPKFCVGSKFIYWLLILKSNYDVLFIIRE
jgi:hypothetical protein